MAGSHGSRTMGDESQAVAELDQIIARRRSRAAASAVNRKVRMSEEHVALIMSMKRCDMPSDEDEEKLERLSRRHPDRYTPEVLEGMRREHKELVAMFRRDDEEHEAMQAEVMREMADKGYVETDEVDQTYVDEVNEWTRVQWEAMVSSSDKLSRMRLSDEENAELLQDFITRQAEEQQQHQEEDYYR